MQIVIDIPEEIHRHTQEYEVGGFNRENDTKLFMAIKNGTPLPKGHGRLIDADDIDNHIIGHVDTRSCPTIIEADGGGRMLREEAIAFFKDMNECTYGNLEAVEMAIEALEQEPCGDVVSRQAAINAAIDGADKWDGGFNREREKRIREEIERLPSVTAQPKMGYISIDDVMSVFDDFMRGDADENDTKTFLAMLKDKAESEE